MADEVSAAELGRRQDAHELRTDRIHAELEAHINRVAAEMVPLNVYQADQRALAQQQAQAQRDHDDDLRQLREDVIKPLTERVSVLERLRTMGFGRWVGVLGVVAAFASVIVTAWATSKGASH